MLPPPLPARPRVPRAMYWTAVGSGLTYGLLLRLVFGQHQLDPLLNMMSVAFLFFVPFALGFLTVSVGESQGRWPWSMRIMLPWLPALLSLGCALAIAWEGIICVVIWAPLHLIMTTLGSLVAIGLGALERGPRQMSLAFCLMLPFVIAPIEKHIAAPVSLRTVATAIEIHAEPDAIWKQIERVPPIRIDEQRRTLTQGIGFPRPIEATLSYEGVGGIRHATFEGNVLFVETVHTWEPNQRLAFSIRADTSGIPATTLDEHVTVGGAFFDVLDGEYRIERIAPSRCILHLASQHRLSTHFNFYAGLWTEFIMRDVQQNILEVIRRRCERK